MSGGLRLLVLGLALARTLGSARATARTVALRGALSFIALVTMLTGLGFLLAAAYMFAATLVGPLYGALLLGAILLLKGMVWMALGRHLSVRG